MSFGPTETKTYEHENEQGLLYLAVKNGQNVRLKRVRQQNIEKKAESNKYDDLILVRAKTIKKATEIAKKMFWKRSVAMKNHIKSVSLS